MLTSLAYIIILGLALGYLCTKLRLPALIGMLVAGICLGPYCLDLISPEILNISIEIRKIALVIILLRAGLALNINELKQVGRPALLLCFVPACVEMLGFVLLAPQLLGVSVLDAAIMGSVVAAVSPAVVVPKMLGLMDKKIGTDKGIPQMIMAGGSVDDVFVIVIFTALTTLASGGEVSASSFASIPISIILGLIVGLSSGYLMALYFRRFHLRDTIKLLIVLSISFLFLAVEGWVKDVVAFSGLLAVMSMGVSLLKFRKEVAQRLSPKLNKLWVGAEIMLFVLVGASVDISYATAAGLMPILLIFCAIACRMAGVVLSMIKTPLTRNERLFCAIAYLPKATVQAAIGGIPLAMGLPCGNIVLTVSVLAILITAPLGAFGIDISYKKLLQPSKIKK